MGQVDKKDRVLSPVAPAGDPNQASTSPQRKETPVSSRTLNKNPGMFFPLLSQDISECHEMPALLSPETFNT